MNTVSFKPTSNFLELANKIFKEQKTRIMRILPFADVQHIGSTAIPSSITKGDLDLVVRVPKEEFKCAMEKLQ